ncbi:hypothetical protein [Aureimonas sp. AU4]|uniref:hypothetical protein n=1 Tax=Aureimonas sp. AU4 TaxID=1638163 RepID=UPI0007866C01|nr:hypothetical protein [Aureimonas sp. AU4]
MSQLAEEIIDLPLADDLNAAIDEAIRLSGGDARRAIGALIRGQRSIQDAVGASVSAGYAHRGLGR